MVAQQVVFQVFGILIINENIIKVANVDDVKIFSQDIIHKLLAGGRSICETKWYHKELI